MGNLELTLTVAIIALATLLTRALPFLVFKENRPMPKIFDYLGKALPSATFGMLVVYCLSGINVLNFPYGIPELSASAVALLSQLFFKKTLLSILLATLVYILLVSFVF